MLVPTYTFSRTRLYGNTLKHPVYHSVNAKAQPIAAHQVIMKRYPEMSLEEAGKVIHLSEQARDWNSIGHYEMPRPLEDILTNDLNVLRTGWEYLGVTTQDKCVFFHQALGIFTMDMLAAVPLLSMGNIAEIPLQFVAEEGTGIARLATEAQIQQQEAISKANPKRYLSSLTENDIGYTFLLDNQRRCVYAGRTADSYVFVTEVGLEQIPRECSHYRNDVVPTESIVCQLNRPVSLVPMLHVPYTQNEKLSRKYDVDALIRLIDNIVPIMGCLEQSHNARRLHVEFRLQFANHNFHQVQIKLEKHGVNFIVRQRCNTHDNLVTNSSLIAATEQECVDWINQLPIIQQLRQTDNFSVTQFHVVLAT